MLCAQPLALLRAYAQVMRQWRCQVTSRVRHQAISQATSQATCQAVPKAVLHVPKVVVTAVTGSIRATTAAQVNTQVTGVMRGKVERRAKWPIGGDVESTPRVQARAHRGTDAPDHVMTDVRTRSVHSAHADAGIDARQRVPAAIGTTAQVIAP